MTIGALLAWAPAAAAEEQSLDELLTCAPYGPDDQEVCSGEVPSFDGSPLDVDVTKPLNDQGAKKHPLIVMLNGFSNTKHEWESINDEADNRDKWHWNSHWFAKHGYYVLTYTPRGFCHEQDIPPPTHAPCVPEGAHAPWQPDTQPSVTSRSEPNGTIQLKSREIEIRDTQWLAALTAAGFEDVDPDRIAVTGGSYGGGESWLQASQPEWSFPAECATGDAEPAGVCDDAPDVGPLPALKLQVAIPKYPWTDLAYSLAPNGHPRPESCPADNAPPDDDPYYESAQGCWNSDTGDGNPIGVEKLSYVNGFFALGGTRGTFEDGNRTTPNEEGPINIPAWNTRFTVVGDPYDTAGTEDATVRQVRRGLTEFRGAYYQQDRWAAQEDGRKVAIFSIQGWTDDLFPAIESFRMYKLLKRLDPRWPVEVELADVGHARAQNEPSDWHRLNVQAFQFLQSNIGGSHEQRTTVSSQPTVCPGDQGQKAIQRLTATTPEGLSRGRLIFEYASPGSLNNPGGVDPSDARTDPILGSGGCQEQAAEGESSGPMEYSAISAPLEDRYAFVGLGKVRLPDTVVAGVPPTATINVKMWDQAPDGVERLATRGTYRYDAPAYDPETAPGSGAELTVPLFGNHYELEPGHRIRLEISLVDSPFLRPSNVASEVTFGPPTLDLPIRQAGERTVTAPAP